MAETYELAPDLTWIKCLACGRTSHNANDVNLLFCGYCRRHHKDDPRLSPRHVVVSADMADGWTKATLDCGHETNFITTIGRPYHAPCAECIAGIVKEARDRLLGEDAEPGSRWFR